MGIDERPPAERSSTASAREFGFEPPRAARARHGRRHPGHARRARPRCSSGMGGNFAAATPDTDVDRGGAARCRLTVQVSTKLNRSHAVTRRAGADPARAWAAPSAIGRRAARSRHRRGLDGHRARCRGAASHPRRRTCCSEVPSSAAWRRRLLGPDGDGIDWAGVRGRLRPHPRPHRRAWCPASSDFNARVPAPGRVHAAPPAARLAHVPHRDAAGRDFTVNPLEVARACRAGRLLLQTVR